MLATLKLPKTLTIKIDKTPPTVTCSVSPNTLWPPNKKFDPVAVTVTVNDALSGPAGFTLASITSNEGDIASESLGWTIGSASTSGQLMADRNGNGTAGSTL